MAQTRAETPVHHTRRVMRETMPTSYACIKGVPGVGSGQGPRIRHSERLVTISYAALRDPQSPERPSSHTLSLRGSQTSQSSPPPPTYVWPRRPQGYRVGLAPRAGQGPGSAGCRDPGMRATRSRRLPPPGLLPPSSKGLQSYSFPRCHGNFLLLIRTKHPPLLAPGGGP